MRLSGRIDWLAWWQLLRAANAFTAASNVIAGFLLVQRQWQPIGPLLLLILASALLYEAGMVLNDYCDAELDATERPERPIPSGKIAKETARNFGIALLVGGVGTAHIVSWLTSQWLTAQLSIALAATIVAYNAGVKSTHFGPWAMGGCRMMNVLLGASIAANITHRLAGAWMLAFGAFFHAYGLSHVARRETDAEQQPEQMAISIAILMDIVYIAGLPILFDEPGVPLSVWVAICVLLTALEVVLIYRLMKNPSQIVVRQTVGTFISLFILIDAAVSALAAGWLSGLLVLSLLIPTRLLARKLPMT